MKQKSESKQNLIEDGQQENNSLPSSSGLANLKDPADRPLGPVEKTFLLHAERGDCPTVKR